MSLEMPDWTSGHPRIVLTACRRCQNHWYLPRHHCSVCGSADTNEAPANGVGLCVAVTRLHGTGGQSDVPARLALVELDEGPVVMGRVHDIGLVPGARARVAFRHDGHEQRLVPSFEREVLTR